MADVRLENVTRRFGVVTAVNSVNLHIADGEFVALLGPSGCGKTTTLRLIAGLEQADGGRILIGDRDVTQLPPRARDLAMVFQDYALYPHMTVLDNVAYPLTVRGVHRHERAARVLEVAQRLQIAELLERRPGQLSGGQQQRASVARALVHRAQVFLFDEPLSNLDAKLRVEARAFLKRLQSELNLTAVYVTHDQAEAMALAHRMAVMDRGNIMQVGAPLDVYRRPANLFVASFIGNPPMNLLPGRLDLMGRKLVLDQRITLDLTPLLERLRSAPRDGAALTLGIRPEHMTLTPGEDRYALPARVYVIEPLGSELLVTLQGAGQLVSVRLFTDEPPPMPDDLWLALDMSRVFLYGPDGQLVE